jgi:hypothetical protein
MALTFPDVTADVRRFLKSKPRKRSAEAGSFLPELSRSASLMIGAAQQTCCANFIYPYNSFYAALHHKWPLKVFIERAPDSTIDLRKLK